MKRRMRVGRVKRREPQAESGQRWEQVAQRIPLGERLPNPEIVTEDQLAQSQETEHTREPGASIEMFEPSEEDGA